MHGVVSIAGLGELQLRFPSVLSAFVSLLLVYRLARTWLHFDAEQSLIAVIFTSASPEFLAQALSARPYMLSLAVMLLGFLSLQRWMETGHMRFLALSTASIVCLFYLHYLLAPVALLFLVAFLENRGCIPQFRWVPVLLMGSLGVAACFLALPHLLSLQSKAGIYAFAPSPKVSDLFRAALWPEFAAAAGAFIGIAASRCASTRVKQALPVTAMTVPLRQHWGTLMFWVLGPPTVFYLASQLFGVSNFAERYWLWQKPGIALFAAGVAVWITGAVRRFIYILLSFLFLMPWRVHQVEDWKSAAGYIEANGRECRVVVYSGLIESQSVDWLKAQARYLLTPFRFYPLSGTRFDVVPIALQTMEQRNYLKELIEEIQSRQERICFASRNLYIDGVLIPGDYERYFADHEFTESGRKLFPGVSVTLWEPKSRGHNRP